MFYGGSLGTLPDLDLTGGGLNDSFSLDVISGDRDITFEVSIFDGSNLGTVAQSSSGGAETLLFGFDAFSQAGVDLMNATSVRLVVDTRSTVVGDPGTVISNFVATEAPMAPIPLPASALLFLSALAGLGALRRGRVLREP